MLARVRRADPFWDMDGAGVKRARIKRRIVGFVAFVLSVTATGVTVALWLRMLAPAFHQFGIG